LEKKGQYSPQDRSLAFELISRLTACALNAEAEGKADALAWFDAGYFIETCEQAGLKTGMSGYNWVRKASKMRRDDAEIEFAAALICTMKERGSREEHLRKATTGAKPNTLLARNIEKHFGKSQKAF
jgi:hypothetical protein